MMNTPLTHMFKSTACQSKVSSSTTSVQQWVFGYHRLVDRDVRWTYNTILANVQFLFVRTALSDMASCTACREINFGWPCVAVMLVMTLLMCHSMGKEVMNPANKVSRHIWVVDFGNPSLPVCCVEGCAEIDDGYDRGMSLITWCEWHVAVCVSLVSHANQVQLLQEVYGDLNESHRT